jgi:cell wall-associated NlpC family hydrolase
VTAALMVPAAVGVPGAGAATAQELGRAQARIDRSSAALAEARTAAERLGPEARQRLERLERRLQAQKEDLLALEQGLEVRHVEETAAADEPADAADPADDDAGAGDATDDGAVIVLAEAPPPRPVGIAGYRSDPNLNGGVARIAEVVPTLTGDDAATASAIDAYLASKGSPLTGLGAVFVSEGRSAGLDPRFLVAISGAETSFGTYGPSQLIHNPFGMGPGLSYPSWSAAIAAAARNLAGGYYAGEGRVTIAAIQPRWAPNGAGNDPTDLNSNWARNVSTYFAEQGGDPLAPVITSAPLTSLALPVAPGVPVATQGTVAAPVAYGVASTTLTGNSGAGPAAAQAALGQLGTRSVRGGSTPARGFDGSGLVQWAYGEQGVTLPRSAAAQAKAGIPISPRDLEAGDAIFFADPSGYLHHEGLYLGDGQFVHAAGDGDLVKVSSLYEPFFAQAYAGARRY